MNIDTNCPICLETRLDVSDKVQHNNGSCNKFFHRTCIKAWVERTILAQYTANQPEPLRCPACTVRDGFPDLIQIESDVRRKTDAENEPVMILFGRPGRRGNMVRVVRRQDLPKLFLFSAVAVATVAAVLAISYIRQR